MILRHETCAIHHKRYVTAVTPGVCPWCFEAEMQGEAIGYTGEDFPCRHRGAQIDEVVCQLCGRRGEPVAIYACALQHGECSLRRFKVGEQIHSCITCEDRQA